MANKINPRRKPATQEDVNRAWGEGVIEGIRCMEAITLNCLCDKYADQVDVEQFWNDLNKLSESFAEGRFTIPDIRNTLKEEYKVLLLTGPSKAIYNTRRKK
jgi:hypothetical protein